MSLVKPMNDILSQTDSVSEKVLTIIKGNPRASYRTILLLLGEEYSAQQVWDCLKDLRKRCIVEMVKLSNRKVAYKLQAHITLLSLADRQVSNNVDRQASK